MITRLRLAFAFAALFAGGCATHSIQPVEPPAFVRTKSGEVPEFLREAGYYDGAALEVSRTVAPGIEHKFVSEEKGPLTINTLFIDMSRPDLVLEAEKGQDGLYKRETVDEMAHRLFDPAARPIVAINADFWAGNSAPVNIFVDEGMIWRSPYLGEQGQRRSIFAFDDEGNYYIGQPKFKAELISGDHSLEIDDINFPQAADVVAYTWPFGDKAPAPPEGWSQVVLTLQEMEPATEGYGQFSTEPPTFKQSNRGVWLPNKEASAYVHSTTAQGEVDLHWSPLHSALRNLVVLHIKGAVPEWLKEYSTVTLRATLEPLPGKVIGVVGGGPQLVDEGEVVVMDRFREEAIGESFTTDRHPRTAVGIMPDGKTLVFMVVDGRQPSRSEGINLPDLAERFKALGVRDAMNLDGGGSSSMLVRGDIVNFPSDAGGPRSVTNALVVRRTAEIGEPTQLEILPSEAVLPSFSEIELTARAFDDGNEPVSLKEGWNINLEVVSGDATIEGNKLKTGNAGEVRVKATAKRKGLLNSVFGGGPTATAVFRVEDPASVEVHPRAVLLSEGDSSRIRLQAFTADGEPFWQDAGMWKIDTSPNVAFDAEEQTIKALGMGRAEVRATLGNLSVSIPTTVDEFAQTVAYDFDALPKNDMGSWISAVRHNAEKTRITLENGEKKEGAAAWRWEYGMEHGGTTKIALPVNVTLPGEPLAVGIWVHGDGKGQWLRGLARDASGTAYYLDFTNSGAGIDWEGWKFVRATLIEPSVSGQAKGPFTYPVTVEQIYIAQAQEAAKRDGVILVDALTALSMP